MPKRDKRIDAYIAKAEPFAKPILKHLRELVHEACPDTVETMKWSFPHFDYKGVMCSMASFKKHAVFGFWKASLMKDKSLTANAASEVSMGHLGKLTSVKDLPADKIMLSYIREAARLNENGARIERKVMPKKSLVVPAFFKNALARNKAAQKTFEGFSPSNKREYVDWVTGAKTEDTKAKRLETSIEWMAEGKIRNWKYVR